MRLTARVGIMPNGTTIVVCYSAGVPIPKQDHNKILVQINEQYTVEESMFLSHGVIVRVKGKTVMGKRDWEIRNQW